jgi:hypothetical protein
MYFCVFRIQLVLELFAQILYFVNRHGEEGSGLSIREIEMVESYVKASDFWETHKINDIDVGLIREIIRLATVFGISFAVCGTGASI